MMLLGTFPAWSLFRAAGHGSMSKEPPNSLSQSLLNLIHGNRGHCVVCVVLPRSNGLSRFNELIESVGSAVYGLRLVVEEVGLRALRACDFSDISCHRGRR